VGGVLRHRHIARLHTTFQDESALYYVYEHVPGGELWQRCMQPACPGAPTPLAPVPMAPAIAARVLVQLVAALAAMHAQGIVHRDLKPENVMVAAEPPDGSGTPSPTSQPACPLPDCDACAAFTPPGPPAAALPWAVKVIDFATCKDCVAPRYNSRTEFIGTPDYMAPECLDNKAAAGGAPSDSRADLWALGAIAYQLLTGVPPFKSTSTFLTMEAALDHDREDSAAAAMDGLLFPVGVPPAGREFVQSLLRRDRRARLGSVPEIHDALSGGNQWTGPQRLGWDRTVEALPPAVPVSPTGEGEAVRGTGKPAPWAGGGGDSGEAGDDSDSDSETAAPALAGQVVQSSRTAAAAAARRRKAAAGATVAAGAGVGGGGGGGDRLPRPHRNQAAQALATVPAEATVPTEPVWVDHSAVAGHGFIATYCRAAMPHGGVDDHSMYSARLQAMATAVCACDAGEERSGATVWDDDAVDAVAVGAESQSLLHLLALRRRLWTPAAMAAVAAPHFARCGRVFGVEWDSAGAALHPRRLAEHGPREWLGQWVAPSGYLSARELTSVAASWHAAPTGDDDVADGARRWAREAVDRLWPDRTGSGTEAVNARGWRNCNAADLTAPSYTVVIAHPCMAAEETDPGPARHLRAVLHAVQRLQPRPRAVVLCGKLTATFAREGTLTRTTILELAALARTLAERVPRQTAVLLAGEEGLDHAVELSLAEAALRAEGAGRSCDVTAIMGRMAQLRAFSQACGAWLSGSRWLIAQPDVCAAFTVPAPVVKAAGSAAAQHAAVDAFRRALPPNARWLSQASEMAKVSAHHTFLLLRGAATEAMSPPASDALPLPSVARRWIADECSPRVAILPAALPMVGMDAASVGFDLPPATVDTFTKLHCATLVPSPRAGTSDHSATPVADGEEVEEVDTHAPTPVPVMVVPPLEQCVITSSAGVTDVRLHLIASDRHGADAWTAIVQVPLSDADAAAAAAADRTWPPVSVPLDADHAGPA